MTEVPNLLQHHLLTRTGPQSTHRKFGEAWQCGVEIYKLGMSEKRKYAIAAYLALCRIFANFSKMRILYIFQHILAALNILCSNFSDADDLSLQEVEEVVADGTNLLNLNQEVLLIRPTCTFQLCCKCIK